MNRSAVLTVATTVSSSVITAMFGVAFKQPSLAIVGGILLVAFASMVLVAFVVFLPIMADRARIDNANRPSNPGRPPDP